MKLRDLWSLVKEAVSAWIEDYAPSMGAALAYYALFSIAPMLLIVVAVAGLFFGADEVRGALGVQLAGLLGPQGAQAVEEMLNAANRPTEGGAAALLSGAVLLVAATTVFAELQSALDRIWQAPAREPTSGLWSLVRARLLSFGMILAIAFLLLISLVVSAMLSAVGKWWGSFLGGWEAVAHAVHFVFSLALITVLFALIYKFIPRARIHWRDVWIGAAITALFFTVGKMVIGLYIGKSDVASSFGAAGSVAVLMVWVYYSTQLFLLGAEFTWVYAHRFGSRRHSTRPRTADTGVESADRAPEAVNGKASNYG
jgi:membrane protein